MDKSNENLYTAVIRLDLVSEQKRLHNPSFRKAEGTRLSESAACDDEYMVKKAARLCEFVTDREYELL